MYHMRLNDLRREYAELVKTVYRDGEIVAPRGSRTHEIRDFVLSFTDARHCTFPSGIGRDVSVDVLSAEMMQWIAGVSDLRQLTSVAAVFANFSDDGVTLYGAYGPRAHAGFRRAVELLSDDPNSRQATVPIWRHDETTVTRDLPCTVSWSFLIRGGALHMSTYMRSNDVWLGLAYDVPIMARICQAMAWALGVDVGSYTHHAQSMHIYDRDVNGLIDLHEPNNPIEPPTFDDIGTVTGSPMHRWERVVEWSHAALLGANHLPDAFAFYADRLRGTEHHSHFCRYCRYYMPSSEHICRLGQP